MGWVEETFLYGHIGEIVVFMACKPEKLSESFEILDTLVVQ